jgi:hypothetical protein
MRADPAGGLPATGESGRYPGFRPGVDIATRLPVDRPHPGLPENETVLPSPAESIALPSSTATTRSSLLPLRGVSVHAPP